MLLASAHLCTRTHHPVRRYTRVVFSSAYINEQLRSPFESDILSLRMTELTLTAVYEEAEEGGYVAYVAELPGANTQGETLDEARENLREAIQLILETNRETFEKNFSSNAKVTRERLVLRAA